MQNMKLPSLWRIDISEIGCETQDPIKVIEQQVGALIRLFHDHRATLHRSCMIPISWWLIPSILTSDYLSFGISHSTWGIKAYLFNWGGGSNKYSKNTIGFVTLL